VDGSGKLDFGINPHARQLDIDGPFIGIIRLHGQVPHQQSHGSGMKIEGHIEGIAGGNHNRHRSRCDFILDRRSDGGKDRQVGRSHVVDGNYQSGCIRHPDIPEIEFSGTIHNFGEVLIGEYTDWPVTIRNIGLTDLVVDSAVSTHGDFQLVGLSLPLTIPAADSAVTAVRFAPSDIGARAGQVRVYSTDRDESPTVLQVNGIGVIPDIHLSGTSHDYGDVVVNRPSDWPLFIYNHDVGNLIVTTVTTNNDNFSILNPDFPDTVAFGDSLELAVRFVPSKTGPITGILKVMSNDPDESQLSISVGGNGVVPDISLAARSHYFGIGVLCDTVSWTLQVMNTGTAALTVDSVRTDVADYAALSPVFPQSVLPGDTLDILIGFIPTRLNSITGTFFLFSDDPDEDSVVVNLSGICYAPDIELAEGSHDFGSVPIGYSGQWSVSISMAPGCMLYVGEPHPLVMAPVDEARRAVIRFGS